MERRGKLLLADDSVVVRKLVSDFLLKEPCVESVTTASNGRLALERFEQSRPDLVILDVEMPELDGLAVLRAIKAKAPEVPVIMFSALTERGGAMTLDALALGAGDYVTKPTQVTPNAVSADSVRHELARKVRALLERVVEQPSDAPAPSFRPVVKPQSRRAWPVELLAIGASTGGPTALSTLLKGLAAGLSVPVVVTQHMPPLFTRLFAERLSRESCLTVREAAGGESLAPGEVWIAPGGFHLTVREVGGRRETQVSDAPPENSTRPSVDVMFRSVASTVGRGVLSVVLTGMGHDGLKGAEWVRSAGGQVMVQDEASSVVWSMPGSIAQAGLADEVVGIEEMARVILRRLSPGRVT